MKRFLYIFTLLIASVSLTASAEDGGSAASFGLRIGIDTNLPGKWHNGDGGIKMFRTGFGASLGGVCNVALPKGFWLEPGVSLYYDAYRYYNMYLMDGQGEEEHDPGLWKLGLRVPVMAGYDIPFSDRLTLSVFTGPELNWSFAGGYDVRQKWARDQLGDLFKEQRRVDCAWKVGVGIPFDRIFVSLDAAIGLTDLLKSPDISFRENRVSLSATYFF